MLFLILIASGIAFAETAVYTYDAAHRLIQVNENGTIIEYQYDSVGNLQQRLRRFIATTDPADKYFGSIEAGNSSAPQTFTITNAGTASITLNTVGLSGADVSSFSLTNGCAGLLLPGTTCSLQITFMPTSTGTKIASAQVTFSDPATLKLDIPVTGTGFTQGVRIVRGTPVYFGTFQAAYNAAVSGEVIQIQAVTLVEDVVLNRDIAVSVEGGYDANFTTNNGGLTFIQGSIHTSAGSANMMNMRVIQ